MKRLCEGVRMWERRFGGAWSADVLSHYRIPPNPPFMKVGSDPCPREHSECIRRATEASKKLRSGAVSRGSVPLFDLTETSVAPFHFRNYPARIEKYLFSPLATY